MIVNTNNASLKTVEVLKNTMSKSRSSLEKLGSGLAINKASDDNSGLAIADQLRTQASSIRQSVDNAHAAISFLDIADKAMSEQSSILDTIKQKLLQAKTATTSTNGREAILNDIKGLLSQIDNIASQTHYVENNKYMLQFSNTDTSPAPSFVFHLGEYKNNTIQTMPDNIQSNTVGFKLDDLASIDNSDFTKEKAGEFLAIVDDALDKLNGWRADYGSTRSQVESSMRNMMTEVTNLKNSESVIRDVDYATESLNFAQSNIISQSGTFALSQANSTPKQVLQLLR
jgi:flagellin